MVTCIKDFLPPTAHFELVSCKCKSVGHKDCQLPWVATYNEGECQFYQAKELHHKFADKLLKMKREREDFLIEVPVR